MLSTADTKQIRDFTQGKIFRQLLMLALPLMAISFIQMTYNMVDLIWIGRRAVGL
jgi:Na+-driven multidrug efflux pump